MMVFPAKSSAFQSVVLFQNYDFFFVIRFSRC